MIKPVDYVKKVRDILKYKKNWCQNNMAENMHGAEVEPNDFYACRWCLAGALELITPRFSTDLDTENKVYDIIVKGIMNKSAYRSIVSFNDNSTHEEVVDMLNSVVEELENEMQEMLKNG